MRAKDAWSTLRKTFYFKSPSLSEGRVHWFRTKHYPGSPEIVGPIQSLYPTKLCVGGVIRLIG